jgi:hypothetical protein
MPFEPVGAAGSPFGVGSDEYDDWAGGVRRPDAARRWPWLAGLVAVALLAVTGLVALLSAVPRNSQPRPAVTLGSPSASPLRPTAGSVPATIPVNVPDATDLANTLRPTVPAPHTVTPPLTTPTVKVPPPTRPGPKLVPVPRLTGLLAATAIAVLRSRGFGVNVVAGPIGDPKQANRVVLQSPAAGQPALLGSVVTIVIGAGIQPR